MQIKKDNLTHPQVRAMLKIHLSAADENTANGASHALPFKALRAPDITVWSAWLDDHLMGIGALKELSLNHGEVKSVHTAKTHRRKGVSSALMSHIISEARRRNYEQLSLETHPTEGYAAARALYSKLGFFVCPAFDPYEDCPGSTFMTMML